MNQNHGTSRRPVCDCDRLSSREMSVKLSLFIFVLLLMINTAAEAKAEKIDDYHWTGVDRVVVIGDIHGDYDQYIRVMESAGLLNRRGRWSGGETHLVQTGDIPSRGDDTRKIVDHLVRVARQAERAGGYVHMLIGNHEAMNVVGDLRYKTPGEFAAFETRNSARLQDMQWQRQVEWMSSNDPAFAEIDLETYRKEWEKTVPRGWVEHRQAWALTGEYGEWVKGNPVALRVNDSLFLHGGISAKYCKFSLESLTEQVIAAMEHFDPTVESILYDELGPLWYRGMARENETEIYGQTLDNILERYGVKRIVVGHSPTGGAVWPRFDQRVIVNDTGIGAYFGSHIGILELTADGATAIYGDTRIPLPEKNTDRAEYLKAVIEADSNSARLEARVARMLAPSVVATGNLDGGPRFVTRDEGIQAEQAEPPEKTTVVSETGTCQ